MSIPEARLLPENSITSFTSDAYSESSMRQRLKEVPVPVRNAILAASVSGLGAFVFGYSLGFTSPVLTAMEVLKDGAVFDDVEIDKLNSGDTVTLDSADASLFSSVINIGAMLGAILGGWACDRLGRKGTITLAALPFALSWACIAYYADIIVLLAARFTVGVTVGVVSMAVPLYIGEVAPTELRGALGAVNQFGVTTGILTSYVAGILVQAKQQTAVHCATGGDDGANVLLCTTRPRWASPAETW